MRRLPEQFLLLLSASGFSERELLSLLRNLQEYPPELIVDIVYEFRREMQHRLKDHPPTAGPLRRPRRGVGHPKHAMVSQAAQLLRDEAGLTVARAARELLDSLREENRIRPTDLKPPNRESFNRWLVKLLDRVGPSILLHHATRIRNRYVHHTESDWPLKDPASDGS